MTTTEPVYPERVGAMTLVMLDESTLDIVNYSLYSRSEHCLKELNDCTTEFTKYWATQLWAIDRACRVLGIDS